MNNKFNMLYLAWNTHFRCCSFPVARRFCALCSVHRGAISTGCFSFWILHVARSQEFREMRHCIECDVFKFSDKVSANTEWAAHGPGVGNRLLASSLWFIFQRWWRRHSVLVANGLTTHGYACAHRTKVNSFSKCQCLHICSSLMLIIYLDFLRQLALNLLQTIYLLFFSRRFMLLLLCCCWWWCSAQTNGTVYNEHTRRQPALRHLGVQHSKWICDVCFCLVPFQCFYERLNFAMSSPFCGQTAHMVQCQDSFSFSTFGAFAFTFSPRCFLFPV